MKTLYCLQPGLLAGGHSMPWVEWAPLQWWLYVPEDDDLAAIIEDLKMVLAQATEENNQLKDELSQQQLESEVVKTALEEKVRTLEQEKESLREAASSTGVEELSNFRHSHQGCSIRQTAPKLFSDDLWLLSYCTDHGASGTNLS